MTTDLPAKIKRYSLGFQLLAGAAVLVLLAPFLLSLMKAAAALAITAVIFTLVVAFGPLWSKMLANAVLKGAVAEATRNPIETLWSGHATRMEKLTIFAKEVQAFQAKIMDTEDQYKAFVKKYPSDGEKFQQMLIAMRQLLTRRKAQFLAASRALEQQRHEIERAEAMFKMALAANSLQQASGSTVDIMQQIMEKTALERVGNEVNLSFAQLDQLMIERVDEKVVEGVVIQERVAA